MNPNADTHVKETHLGADEMKDLLDTIGFAGVLRAVAAWSEGRRPKNIRQFRAPNGWMLLVAGRTFAHRPLIALASEMCGERELNPNNFGLQNDTRCKKWLSEMGFETTVP
jgi:hypothetical protein